MSWSRRALVTGLAALGGCGFEPVYATRNDAPSSLQADLAAIEVPDANTVLTYEFRSAVVDQLNPTRVAVPPRYRLDWRLARRATNLAIQVDAVVTRQDMTLAATYALVDLEADVVVDRGRVERTASFNIRREPFNDLVAREDAERRAAIDLAAALRQQLIAHFEREAAA